MNIDFKEAERCLNCKIPKCVEGCPINNRIPDFIEQIKKKDYKEAYRIIRTVSPLGAICGRVCPHENQCQGSCVKGLKSNPIEIGKLEYLICDWARENKVKLEYNIKENNIKIAIIGSGPAGIACAVELRILGYDVTIFEKENFLGGILMYGIPDYRLPKKIVTEVINDLIELGIKVKLNTILRNEIKNECRENVITIEKLLKEGYNAIFLGIGSELSNFLSIDGSKETGVYGANEFLRIKQDYKDKKIVVIGGGNVAMDSARVAKKAGADVTLVYRRKKEDMPASKNEIEFAEKEGIKFIFNSNVKKIISSNNNKLNLELILDFGSSIKTDYVVMAIGSTPNKDYLDNRLKLTQQGLIYIDDNYETSIENVFAGGDLVQRKATVCMAIKNGKEAAKAIDKKMKKT